MKMIDVESTSGNVIYINVEYIVIMYSTGGFTHIELGNISRHEEIITKLLLSEVLEKIGVEVDK